MAKRKATVNKLDETAPFVCRAYGRASTDGQARSTEQQEAVAMDAFNLFQRIRPNWKNGVWGGFFKDEATSRISKFREREAGSLLLAASQPGDVILVSNYDRIFANVVDVCETLEYCRERQIRLLILDCEIDTTTDFGESIFKLLAVIKEMDVKETRRRVREMATHRKRTGLPMGRPPIGWDTVAVKWHGRICRFYTPNRVVRQKAIKLVALLDEWNFGWRTAWKRTKELRIKNPATGRKFCSFAQLREVVIAVRQGFPLPNGQNSAAPIPADAEPLVSEFKVDAEDESLF